MNTPTVTVGIVKTPAPPACVADVELKSGWACHVDWTGAHFNVLVTGPHPERGIELHLWDSLADVYETLAAWFGNRGLSHIWVVMKASIEAEIR